MDVSLSPCQLIQKKRDGLKLEANEIKWFINQYTAGKIVDAQMSALLMAIFLKGMAEEETEALTDSMLYSGEIIKFSENTSFIDKHSTGGVGDKTSFILAPIAHACGISVPMVAGKGLGHSGGTVDKANAIPGFRSELSIEAFKNMVEEFGLAMMGQTAQFAPADRKIYGLRDITGTVESIPLITASIMSKKLAEGTSGLVMDVKYGQGAFMQTLEDARALASSIAKTALRFNKNIMTFITNMDTPLGHYIGNSLEIIESLEVLKGQGPSDLREISLKLAAGMIFLGKKAKSFEEALDSATKALDSHKALESFRLLVEKQGGDTSCFDDYSKLPQASKQTVIEAKQSGTITKIDTKALGLTCVDLGGGRRRPDDQLDYSVGLIVHQKLGEKIEKGSPLLTIHHRPDQDSIVSAIEGQLIEKIFTVESESNFTAPDLIAEQSIQWSDHVT